MRIAIVVDYERVLMNNRGALRRRAATVDGRKTILRYTLDEVNQDRSFELIQSLIGGKTTLEGLLICQPAAEDLPNSQKHQMLSLLKIHDGDLVRVYEGLAAQGVQLSYSALATFCAKLRVEGWLTGLTSTRGIQCRQEYYDPKSGTAGDTVLAAIDAFPVVYVKSLNDLKNSANPNRFLRATEVSLIFSEHWREIKPSGVRHLPDLIPTKISSKRGIGYRESEVYEYLQKKLSQDNTLA